MKWVSRCYLAIPLLNHWLSESESYSYKDDRIACPQRECHGFVRHSRCSENKTARLFIAFWVSAYSTHNSRYQTAGESLRSSPCGRAPGGILCQEGSPVWWQSQHVEVMGEWHRLADFSCSFNCWQRQDDGSVWVFWNLHWAEVGQNGKKPFRAFRKKERTSFRVFRRTL